MTDLRSLNDDSNIKKFSSLFCIVEQKPSDSPFKYLFRWDADRDKIKYMLPASDLSKKVKELSLVDTVFHSGIGVIDRKDLEKL